MSSEKKKSSKVKAENKTKKKINTKKVAIVTGVSILAVIIALLITVYALFHYFYNKMTIETADTGTQDLRELAAILREDLDADVSGFPQKDVDAARSAIVLEKIELLPKAVDYDPIVDILEQDINADISDYSSELTPEHIATLRWGVYYGLGPTIKEDIVTDDPADTSVVLPDDTDKGGDETTTSPEVTTPEVTTPEVTTPEVTTPEVTPPEVTTPADTTTPTPETTKKPETTPVVTEKVDPSISTAVTDTEPPMVTGGTVTDADIYNVLIIGCDTRGTSFTGRSDTIMVASINKVSKRIVLSSFMRDTIVHDPYTGGYAKINAFFARSGSVGERAGKLINAIKHNFEIDIHNYVVVNMRSFYDIVNIFGGVDVPLYYSEYIELNRWFKGSANKIEGLDDLYTDKKNGYITVSLNAEQALMYARIRKNLWNPASQKYQRSDDSYRTERQRYVVKGLIQKARHMSLDQVISIANQILPLVATDLDANGFLVKMTQYTDFSKYSIDMINLTYTKKAWYPCVTNGSKLIFHGDPGYNTLTGAYSGVGILEAPYRDGYALIKEAWRLKVYQ